MVWGNWFVFLCCIWQMQGVETQRLVLHLRMLLLRARWFLTFWPLVAMWMRLSGLFLNPIFSCVQESSTYFPLSWRFEESKPFRWSAPATAQVCCRGDNKSKQETAGRDMLLLTKSPCHREAELCDQGSRTDFILNPCFLKPQWAWGSPDLIFSWRFP